MIAHSIQQFLVMNVQRPLDIRCAEDRVPEFWRLAFHRGQHNPIPLHAGQLLIVRHVLDNIVQDTRQLCFIRVGAITIRQIAGCFADMHNGNRPKAAG